MRFEWIREKALRNERKHGVSFQEASEVFRDPLSLTFPDQDHSLTEDRFLTIGMTLSRKVLVVAHSFRDEAIRIISARQATSKERRFYEQQTRH